jgi:hypothetical protein
MSENDWDEPEEPPPFAPLRLEARLGVYATLHAIEAGTVTLAMTTPHGDVEYPEYIASNGYRFRIFDDNGGWDYLVAFTRKPSGEWIGWPDPLHEAHPLYDALMRYRPRDLGPWHWIQNGVSPGGYRA